MDGPIKLIQEAFILHPEEILHFFTSIDEIVLNQPDNFILKQNYPNPFNPVTTIEYEITSKGFINLSVYNIHGKKQTELVNKIQNTGNYKVNFNGSNLPTGVYFYTMFVNGKRVDTKKMMLLK
ncbi:MAG: T9SS type A sorting domain-containing protein [Ignavibacteria bacterium]|nr:T9SS type A sorting domain-containing protein [Ignavibacteria bacterium]